MVFNWLHLTDLHIGQNEQATLWPQLRDKFFADITRLHDVAGPWDIVIFSGDLVQQGKPDEYDRIEEFLGRLWTLLDKHNSHPVLLAVPGNHDVKRPDRSKSGIRDTLDALRAWDNRPDIQEDFWSRPKSTYRRLVSKSLAAYEKWWRNTEWRPPTLSEGILPGDFSFTLDKHGAKLGILGLNTTFLQLAGGDFREYLAVDPLQFHQACNGDGPAWTGQHHATFLVTHQPSSWFTRGAREAFTGEIAEEDRFTLHLFGHMHEAEYKAVQFGGGALKRSWQGRSLFGLEYIGDEKKVERLHGYSAGRLELVGGRIGKLTLFPREARKNQGGSRRFVPDFSYELFDCWRTLTETVELRSSYEGPKSADDAKAQEPIPRLATKEQRSTAAAPPEIDIGALTRDSYRASSRAREADLPERVQLIGRDREFADIVRLLREGWSRLVTLTGPGGVGKSALALSAAHELRRDYRDGVAYARFVPVESAQEDANAAFVTEITAAVRIASAGANPEALAVFLQHRHMLILLDSFEQASHSAPLVPQLLQRCPLLTLLVASRTPLRAQSDEALRFEREFSVAPLPLPEEGTNLEELSANPSVVLCLQSASASGELFTLTHENAQAVIAACRKAGGLPLALRVAGAQLRAAQIAAPGQSGGTVSFTIESLPGPERGVLTAAANFPATFTADALSAVKSEADVAATLDALRRKFLIEPSPSIAFQQRYTIHDRVRQMVFSAIDYESDRLAMMPRFASFFRDLAETAEPKLTSAERVPRKWMERLNAEEDNLRAAMKWSLEESDDHEPGICIAGALFWNWLLRGMFAEAKGWLTKALDRLALHQGNDEPSSVSIMAGRVYYGLGGVNFMCAEYDTARTALEESIRLFQRAGERGREGYAQIIAGMVALEQGRTADSLQALTIARDLLQGTDEWGYALALNDLGRVVEKTEGYEKAEPLFAGSIEIWRKFEDPWGLPLALNTRAVAAYNHGDFEHAIRLNEDALRRQEERGDVWGTAATLRDLGAAHIALGNVEQAVKLVLKGLALDRELGRTLMLGRCFEVMSTAAVKLDDFDEAAVLLGVADAIFERTHAGRSPKERDQHREVERAVQAHGMAAHTARGRAMSLEAAVAEVFTWAAKKIK